MQLFGYPILTYFDPYILLIWDLLVKALFLTDVVQHVLISRRATRPIQCVVQADESLIKLELVGGLNCRNGRVLGVCFNWSRVSFATKYSHNLFLICLKVVRVTWFAIVSGCLAALARIQSHLPDAGDSWLKASSIGQNHLLGSSLPLFSRDRTLSSLSHSIAAMSFFEPRLKPLPDAFYSEGDASPVRPEWFVWQWATPKSSCENDHDHHFPYSKEHFGEQSHFQSHSGAPQQRWVAVGPKTDWVHGRSKVLRRIPTWPGYVPYKLLELVDAGIDLAKPGDPNDVPTMKWVRVGMFWICNGIMGPSGEPFFFTSFDGFDSFGQLGQMASNGRYFPNLPKSWLMFKWKFHYF